MANKIVGVSGLVNGTVKASYDIAGGKGIRKSGSATWAVIGETASTSEDSIVLTSGLPQLYGLYNSMWAKKVEAHQAKPAKHPDTNVDTWLWYVTISFDSRIDTKRSETNPLMWRTKVSRDSETELDRLIYDAVTGDPVANFFGQPFVNLKRRITMPVYTFQRYESYPYSDSALMGYTNAVNAATFRGAPIGTVWMMKVRTVEEVINDTLYENVSYVTKFRIDPDDPTRQDTWQALQEHVSDRYIDAVDGSTQFEDSNGNHGMFHIKNADGKRLGYSDPVEYLAFNEFRKVAFPSL